MKKFNAFMRSAAAMLLAASMVITVVPVDAAKAPKLSKTKLNLAVGAKKTIKVKGKSIKKVTWKSTKAKIASVKKKGKVNAVVTAKKKGKAVIKATVISAGKKKVLKCKVTVNTGNPIQPTTAPGVPTTAPSGDPSAPTDTPAPTGPTPVPTETPVPELDENNLAVANYPTIFSDVPDCDMIRVGGNYYMVSTTMNMCPGAPIMKSTDLVNWQLVRYTYDTLKNDDRCNLTNGQHMYTNGQWATSIKYHDGLYYVGFNSNGNGYYIYTTDDIENGEFTEYYTPRGFHDGGLFFDDDRMFIIFGSEGTRQQVELVDNEGGVGEIRTIGDGQRSVSPQGWSLHEGCHAYKRGDYYYLTFIGSPAGRWFRTQICYRTKDLDNGPWETQVVYNGSTYEYGTGLAQGGWVDTIYGDTYCILFQDHDAIGRIPSIVAVNWDLPGYEDWPMMGTYDPAGNFVRDRADQPLEIRLNDSGEEQYVVDDDDFTYEEGQDLKVVWQWNHNPDHDNWSVTDNPGYYRIYNGYTVNNIWFARNSLTQRTVGPKMTSEAAIVTDGMKPGDYAGMVALGSDYGMIGVKCDNNGNRYIFQGSGGCDKSNPSNTIRENATADKIDGDTPVYLKIEYQFRTNNSGSDRAQFYYSLDGSSWKKLGNDLSMRFDTGTTFMGARTWLTSYATRNAGGYADFDYYKVY